MKTAFFILAALLLLGCGSDTGESSGRAIDWFEDYHRGAASAQESGKPMMLFFTADWCPPCVEMKKHVFTDARVIDASQDLVNVYIDVDRDRRTMSQYRVRVIPEFIFLTSGGDTVATVVGPQGVSDLVEHMHKAASVNRGG